MARFALPRPTLAFVRFCLPLLVLASPLQAQWPGSIAGQVVDARSGRGIPAATVEIHDGGGALRTDGSGSFRSRGLDPGEYSVIVRRFGYLDGVSAIVVRNGEVSRLRIELEPLVLPLDGILALGRPEGGAGVVRLDRGEISRMGAGTAGDVARALPGVRVVQRSPGGAQTLSLRGSSEDQVLVLVDGAPLNDPITGEADLSTISAAAIEEVVLFRGARSARFGPGAQGGAILIRTRIPSASGEGTLSGGSLGELGTSLGGGSAGRRIAWGAGGEVRRLRGDFHFTNPAVSVRNQQEAGDVAVEGGADGRLRRENADLNQLFLRGSVDAGIMGGELKARLGLDEVDRGNPGRSFAPSRSARQRLLRTRATLSWRREVQAAEARAGAESDAEGVATPVGVAELSMHSALQKSVSRDPEPPFGLPYDDAARLRSSGLRLDLSRSLSSSVRGLAVAGGLDVLRQDVRSDLLEPNGDRARSEGAAGVGRTDVGLSLRGRWDRPDIGVSPRVTLAARAHRDGLTGGWYAGHEATVSIPAGPLSVHLSNRSSFTPPSLGDQFFRDGVGIEPNPHLRAERVPSEWEAGLSGVFSAAGAAFSIGAEAYLGDVLDMIVWAPDFRFVWSPRNVDVSRSGLEGWGEVHLPDRGLRLSGSYSHSRVTYGRSGARTGGEPAVQLAYRPRNSASITGGWEDGRWQSELTGRYTGLRYPVPAAINAMPGFWTFTTSLSHSWRRFGWTFRPRIRIDRIFDGRDSLIFGYPDPGRTFYVELSVRRSR